MLHRLPSPCSVIPAARYTSPQWAEREASLLWPRAWLYVCFSTDLSHPGERQVLDVGAESAFAVRGDDGQLHGFHNVCRHRGMRLCDNSATHGRNVRCPYHHWTWKSDGKLLSWPDGTQFAQPPGDVALKPVRCEERFGLVWLCFGEPLVSLDTFLAPIADVLRRHRLDRWARSDDVTLDIAANWKTSADVSNELYHIRTIHPEVLPIMNDATGTIEALGPHTRTTVHFGVPSPHMPASAPYDETMRGWQESIGVKPPLDPRTPNLRERLQHAIRARGVAQKLPWQDLTDAELLDNVQLNLFPNTQLNLYAHRIQIYRHRPVGSDPQQMAFDQVAYRPLADGELRPPLPPHKHADSRHSDQGAMMAADIAMVVGLQRGMQSSACDGLRLTDEEAAILHLHRTLDDWLFA